MTNFILELAGLVTALGAIGGGAFSLFKWVIPAIRTMSDFSKNLDVVVRELRPNGGTSLRDAVDIITKEVASIKTHVTKLDAKQWATVAAMENPTWESDPQGNCVRINAALAKLVGRTQDQMAGNGWEAVIHKSDQRAVWDAWTDAVAKQREFEYTYRVQNALTKKHYQVDAIARPIVVQGEVIGWLGVYDTVREVT